MRRLPLHLVISLLAVHVVAFDLFVRSTVNPHAGGAVSALAATVLAFGATAALLERTWGIGLVLAAATSFLAARALHVGPPFFAVAGVIGTLPFVFTVKHMARFHAGATVLFAIAAATIGLGTGFARAFVAP